MRLFPIFATAACCLLVLAMPASAGAQAPVPPVPSVAQLQWQRMEFTAFVHFGPNAFTGVEWGSGREQPTVFNPTALDARQWARTFKAAGMKGVIVTAKHHDGFCLWPTKESTHTVAASPWRDGKGDLLRELSDAARAEGLKFGVYLSPWDRNHPTYGTPEYNDVFVRMLEDVLSNYGEIFEVWFDGANGEGPNGKRQVYDWPRFHAVVRRLQPNAVIFSDAGPDVRWIGNERGEAPLTNWAMLDRDRYQPGTPLSMDLPEGSALGRFYVPGECDVSIRPGWFWRAAENTRVKSPRALLRLYETSVGRNCTLLLNVPPDDRGLIHDNDVKALAGMRAFVDRVYGSSLVPSGATAGASSAERGHAASAVLDADLDSFWAPAGSTETGAVTVDLGTPVTFDRVRLQEYVAQGQRVSLFEIEAWLNGAWTRIANGTTIGHTRIVATDVTTTSRVRVTIHDARGVPLIASLSLHDSTKAAPAAAEAH
ncbi:MAG: alpha-L-fucosidase [Acidobacteria bacterium]|nr:alpha-L-fucosidase [Acidobacteriota bacterium]